MKPSRILPLLGALLGLLLAPLRADYLTNTDFKDSLGGWHGDGERVTLLADGTEGGDTDTNATPVIKLKLGTRPEGIYENYEVQGDLPPRAHLTVDVYASADFKRTPTSAGVFGNLYVPNADFWSREMPSYSIRSINLKPGQWVTLTGTVNFSRGGTDRCIYFTVPPGQGTVYLKNPHITP